MQCSKVSGSISTEEQAEAVASWAALDTLENAAHAFGQMPGSLLGQFSLSRAWFPLEGVKGVGWGECMLYWPVCLCPNFQQHTLPSWMFLQDAWSLVRTAQTVAVCKQSTRILWFRKEYCFIIF